MCVCVCVCVFVEWGTDQGGIDIAVYADESNQLSATVVFRNQCKINSMNSLSVFHNSVL